MKEWVKNLWNQSGKWFLIGLPLAALAIGAAVWQANQAFEASKQTIADPPAESQVTFDLDKNRAYTAEDGIVVIGSSAAETDESVSDSNQLIRTDQPETVWEEGVSLSTETFTLPEEITLEDGTIGTLMIPKINLTAPVYETAQHGGEMESMTKGIAHFAITSAWDGNIGLSSHNVAPEGAVAYFGDLHLLELGDSLTYKTAQGEREYQVTEKKEIAQNDWSYLMRYEDGLNRITMITCITGQPDMRLMVQAVES